MRRSRGVRCSGPAHGDLLDQAVGDALDSAAELADGIRRNDFDLLVAKLRLAGAHAAFQLTALIQETIQDLAFRDVGDALPLHVDDAAPVAREDGHVRALGLAG